MVDATRKPVVVILIGHYLPGVNTGGPLTSIKNIIDNLHTYFEFRVVTTNTDFGDRTPYPGITPNTWMTAEHCEILYLDRSRLRIPQIWKAIRSINPSVLYLNPLLDPVFSGSIVLLNWLGLLPNKKLVVCPRGELFDEALAFKGFKKRCFLSVVQFFRLYRNVRLHATNEKELQCTVKRLKVRPENVHLARVISRYTFDYRLQLGSSDVGEINIVFMARISKDKNLEFVFDVFERISDDISIDFDIFGPLEEEPIWQRCLERIRRLRPNVRVQYRGVMEKRLVRQTLANYDLFFMPTFAENFGHSIAESLSVGTPVLISDNTPWRNLQERGLGWDINLSAVGDFVTAVHQIASMPKSDRMKRKGDIRQKMDSILNDPKIIDENIALFTF